MSLRAPVSVPVEIRADDIRRYRLSASIGTDGVRLERAAPFDIGRPVLVALHLPDGEAPLALRAELRLSRDDDDDGTGGRELTFIDPPPSARDAIERYVAARLGLPSL